MQRKRLARSCKLRKSSVGTLSPRTVNLLKSPKELSTEILKHKKFKLNGKSAAGKHATVDFATRTPSSKYAIKNQFIKSPANIADRAYRELKILEELNTLKEKEYYPNKDSNFISVLDWWKAKDDDTEEPIMHYVLECADITLADVKQLSLYDFKCILFQILFALHIAQKEYEFVHNDLHAKNILLMNREKSEYLKICDGDNTWFTSGYVVKITDFGLSRIKLPDSRIIYNKNKPESHIFSQCTDIDSVFSIFDNIQILEDSWWCSEEISRNLKKEKIIQRKKKELQQIRKMVRDFSEVRLLLIQPFFDELKEKKKLF
jgi:serine/threonine protein kinase